MLRCLTYPHLNGVIERVWKEGNYDKGGFSEITEKPQLWSWDNVTMNFG